MGIHTGVSAVPGRDKENAMTDGKAKLLRIWKSGWRALFLSVSLVVIGHLVERVALSGIPEQFRHYSLALLFVTIGPFIGYGLARYFFTDPKDEDSEGVKWYNLFRPK